MEICPILKEVVILVLLCNYVTSYKDLLDFFRPNPSNPQELNEFLAEVHQHNHDFKWIRKMGDKYEMRKHERYYNGGRPQLEPPNYRHDSYPYQILHKRGDRHTSYGDDFDELNGRRRRSDNNVKFQKRNSRPSNDLYPYMYENDENNLLSLSNINRRDIRHPIPQRLRTKLQRLNRLRRDAYTQNEDALREARAEIIPRSDYGNIPVSGDRFPERRGREIVNKLPNSLDGINLGDYNRDIENSRYATQDTKIEARKASKRSNVRDQKVNNKGIDVHDMGVDDYEDVASINPEENKNYDYPVDLLSTEDSLDVTKYIGVLNVDNLMKKALNQKPRKRDMRVKIFENGRMMHEYRHSDNDGTLIVDFRTTPGESNHLTTAAQNLGLEDEQSATSLSYDHDSTERSAAQDEEEEDHDMSDNGNSKFATSHQQSVRLMPSKHHQLRYQDTNASRVIENGFENMEGLEVNHDNVMEVNLNDEPKRPIDGSTSSKEKEFYSQSEEDDRMKTILRKKLLRKLARLGPNNRMPVTTVTAMTTYGVGYGEDTSDDDNIFDLSLNSGYDGNSVQSSREKIRRVENYLRNNPPYYAVENSEIGRAPYNQEMIFNKPYVASDVPHPSNRLNAGQEMEVIDPEEVDKQMNNDNGQMSSGWLSPNFEHITTQSPISGISMKPEEVNVENQVHRNDIIDHINDKLQREYEKNDMYNRHAGELMKMKEVHGGDVSVSARANQNAMEHEYSYPVTGKAIEERNGVSLDDAMMSQDPDNQSVNIARQVVFPLKEILNREIQRQRWRDLEEFLRSQEDPRMSYDHNKYPISNFIQKQMKYNEYRDLLKRLHTLNNNVYQPRGNAKQIKKIGYIPKRNILLEEEDFEEMNRKTSLATSTDNNIRDLLMDIARSKRQVESNQTLTDSKDESDSSSHSYIPSRQIKWVTESSSSVSTQLEQGHLREKRSYPEFSSMDEDDGEYYIEDIALSDGGLTKRKESDYSDEQDTETGTKQVYSAKKRTSNTLANPSNTNESSFEDSGSQAENADMNDERIKTCKTCSKNRHNKAKFGKMDNPDDETNPTGSSVRKFARASHHKRSHHHKHHHHKHRHHKHHHHKHHRHHHKRLTNNKVITEGNVADRADVQDTIVDDLALLKASVVDRDIQRLIDDQAKDEFKKRSLRKSRVVLVPTGQSRSHPIYFRVPPAQTYLADNSGSYYLPHFNSRSLKSVSEHNDFRHHKRDKRHIRKRNSAERSKRLSDDYDDDDDESDDSDSRESDKISKATTQFEEDYDSESSPMISVSPRSKFAEDLSTQSNSLAKNAMKLSKSDDEIEDTGEGSSTATTTCKNCAKNYKHIPMNKGSDIALAPHSHKGRKVRPKDEDTHTVQSIEYEELGEAAPNFEKLASLESASNLAGSHHEGGRYATPISNWMDMGYDEIARKEQRMQNFKELYKLHPWMKMDRFDQATFDFPSKNVEKRSNFLMNNKARRDGQCNRDECAPTKPDKKETILPIKTENPKEQNIVANPTCSTTAHTPKDNKTNEGLLYGLEELENGHIAVAIVKNVLMEASTNPNLRKFASSLSTRNSKAASKLHFNSQCDPNSDDDAANSEQLLHSIKKVLNKLVLNEIERRMCQHLPPQLKKYLTVITSVHLGANQIEEKQKQHDSGNAMDNEQSSYLFQNKQGNNHPENLTSQIEMCQGLLKKYNNMNDECKEKAEPVKQYIENHLNSAQNIQNCQQNNNCEGQMTVGANSGAGSGSATVEETRDVQAVEDEANGEMIDEEAENAEAESANEDYLERRNRVGIEDDFGNEADQADYDNENQEVRPEEMGHQDYPRQSKFSSVVTEPQTVATSPSPEAPQESRINSQGDVITELDKMVEKELESVGLGKKKSGWHPNFSLEKMVRNKLPTGPPSYRHFPNQEIKRHSGKHKRDTYKGQKRESDKYKKLVNAVEKMQKKRKGEEMIARVYGGEKKRSVDYDDYPSIRSRNRDAQVMGETDFEEPLVYSIS